MRNLKILLIVTALVRMFGAPAMATTDTQVTLLDNQSFAAGSYQAYVAPWGKGTLVQGVDYTESIKLNPATFPNGVTFTGNWPNTPCAAVCGFNAIDFGDYYATVVPTPIPPKQVKAIQTLTVAANFTISGQTDGFDTIVDFFLTDKPGSQNKHLNEIEVFLHSPQNAVDYTSSLTWVGQFYGVGGRLWNVMNNAPAGIFTFMPDSHEDVSSGMTEVKQMLAWLVAQKKLTGEEYFNGLGFGVEHRQGSGSVTVNAFGVTYR